MVLKVGSIYLHHLVIYQKRRLRSHSNPTESKSLQVEPSNLGVGRPTSHRTPFCIHSPTSLHPSFSGQIQLSRDKGQRTCFCTLDTEEGNEALPSPEESSSVSTDFGRSQTPEENRTVSGSNALVRDTM